MTLQTKGIADPPRQQIPSCLRSTTFHGLGSGPRLLVLGAVHGNEVCGTRAIEQILQELEKGSLAIERGTVTFLPIANPLAYQLQQRTGERNLNRNMAPNANPQDFEDRVANVLCPLMAAHDVLLDLHSFHTGGAPFVMIGPQNNQEKLEPFEQALEEMQLALHTGAPRILEGWLDTYALGVQRRVASSIVGEQSQTRETSPNYGVGTTEYMRSCGGYGVTLECGQHDDPQAVVVARHAIIQTLALLGMTASTLEPVVNAPEILRLTDVTDCLHAGDQFARQWRSFDAVTAGDVIGTRYSGEEVTAKADGFIVFPNPHGTVGQEWFYFAQKRPSTF